MTRARLYELAGFVATGYMLGMAAVVFFFMNGGA